MPALVCPHCDTYANFSQRWSDTPTEYGSFGGDDDGTPNTGLYTCNRCYHPIAVIFDDTMNGRTISEWWPTTKARGKEFPDVPQLLAASASEAHLCLNAGSPRGAVAVARSVVESVAKYQGIVKGNLAGKINKLYEDGYISEAMKEAADEIRFAGNETAHGDVVNEPLSLDDAEEIIRLMDTILERVYQEPAEVARIREKRKARNQPSPVAEGTSDEPPF